MNSTELKHGSRVKLRNGEIKTVDHINTSSFYTIYLTDKSQRLGNGKASGGRKESLKDIVEVLE